MAGIILEVEKGSSADKAGLKAGDIVKSVNDTELRDVLDWMIATSEKKFKVTYIRDGKENTVSVKKSIYEPVGVSFENPIFDRIKICQNRCDFCFVDQDPRDVRKTMQIKDDDYRLSFLFGNFITLTNLTEEDWERIEKQRLTPLYVSVHATEPDVRESLMNNKKAGNIIENIKRLVELDISLHVQIVLCPGINDGEHLKKTLEDLESFYPNIESIACVPVGLTKYHTPNRVRSFTIEEMKDVMEIANKFMRGFKKRHKVDNFLYLADEFFIKTGTEIPKTKYYGDFPQLENGIGMMRLFLTSFMKGKKYISNEVPNKRNVSIITGCLTYDYMRRIAEFFDDTKNLELRVHKAESVFWGNSVDVCGLMTGTDILHVIENEDVFDEVIIPSHCLKDGKYFLDGMSLDELQEKTKKHIIPVSNEFKDLRKAIENG